MLGKVRKGASLEWSSLNMSVSFVDAVVLMSENFRAQNMVLPCPAYADSTSARGFFRDPGAWASAAVQENPEV